MPTARACWPTLRSRARSRRRGPIAISSRSARRTGTRPIPRAIATLLADNGGRAHRRGYVAEVDALRCFAMTAVIMVHAGILPFGGWGVWMFFVISGFAITRSLLSDVAGEAGKAIVLRNFFIKRGLRILPLYIFYLAIVALYAAIFHREAFWAALPFLATMTYNVAIAFGSSTIHAPGVSHLWSISGEEQFYLLFPFLFLLSKRRAFVTALICVILLCPIAREALARIVSRSSEDLGAVQTAVAFFTPVHFDAFAAGALIGLVTNGRDVSQREGYAALLVGCGAVVLYAAVYAALRTLSLGYLSADSFRDIFSGHVEGKLREAFSYSVVWLACASLLIAVIARLPILSTVCRPRLFHAIGKVSYGGYVYHGLIIEMLARVFPYVEYQSIWHRFAYFALIYPVTVVIAFGSFVWIERPFLRLRRRFANPTVAPFPLNMASGAPLREQPL